VSQSVGQSASQSVGQSVIQSVGQSVGQSVHNTTLAFITDFSKEKPYNIERNGLYDPYNLTVADLETTHSGTYYCCLPSNCSEQIDEDRCQKFVLTVEGQSDCFFFFIVKQY